MSQFRFDLAGPDDDADLRRVLRATPTDGDIAVRLEREPSWFDAAVVDGRTRQVVACRHGDRIVGFGCRSIRDVYINGRPEPVGYLSSLRLLPEFRRRGLIARGYALFRRLHEDREVGYYLTTIAAGNAMALAVLTSGRAGLPTYHPAGCYHTYAIAAVRARSASVTVRPATAGDLPKVLEFLTEVGPRRQFFPRFRAEDFGRPGGLLRDLTAENILLAWRGTQLVGTLAGWDQFGFRQSIVHRYGGWLRWLRPAYNVGNQLIGRPRLPAVGEPLRCWTAALPVVADDDTEVFAALLAALRANVRGWLLLGLHENDPLSAVANRCCSARYTTQLFLVCWPDGDARRLALDGRPPYLELGSL